jgi:hypothetical protein
MVNGSFLFHSFGELSEGLSLLFVPVFGGTFLNEPELKGGSFFLEGVIGVIIFV